MPVFLLTFFKKFGAWIAGIGAAIAAIFFVLAQAKSVGKAEQKVSDASDVVKANEAIATRLVNETQAAANVQTQAVKDATNAQADVNAMSSDDIANRLRDEWSRKDS